MNIGEALWIAWLVYWASASLVGSFFGVLLALFVRALFVKVKDRMKHNDK